MNSRKRIIFCFLFILFVDRLASLGVDVDFSFDRSHWIDPNDPLTRSGRNSHRIASSNLVDDGTCDSHCGELAQENEKLRRMYEFLENSRENSVDVLLKHILGKIFLSLGVDINSTDEILKSAHVYLSVENFRVVKKYLSSQKANEEFGLREDVRFALEDFIVEASNESLFFMSLYNLVPYITVLNMIVLPAAIWTVIRSIFSVRQFVIVVLIMTFSVSCYSTYMRKYKEVLAQRFERIEKKFDEKCTSDGVLNEAFNLVLSYVRIKDKSECLQHYEDVLIEPIWLIDFLQIIAEVASNFFLTPISVAGSHFNKFFNDFFINTPIYLTVIKCLFLLLLLFYITGYRIRTIFATIEPAVPLSRFIPQSLTHNQTPSINHCYQHLAVPDSTVPNMASKCLGNEKNPVKNYKSSARHEIVYEPLTKHKKDYEDLIKRETRLNWEQDENQIIVSQNYNKNILKNQDIFTQEDSLHCDNLNLRRFDQFNMQEDFPNWRSNFKYRENYLNLMFDDSKVTKRKKSISRSFSNLTTVSSLKRSMSLCRL